MKRCTKCNEVKPATLDYFGKNTDRLRAACKVCCNEATRVRHKANFEKYQILHKAWREANRERRQAYQKAWYEANSHGQQIYRKAHKEANYEKERLRVRVWQEANPEKRRVVQNNRRARLLNALGQHTTDDVNRQFNAQEGKCWWCGVKLKKSGKGKFHVDHVIALSKGGSNGPENIVCACPTCNLMKHTKTPLEFAGRLF